MGRFAAVLGVPEDSAAPTAKAAGKAPAGRTRSRGRGEEELLWKRLLFFAASATLAPPELRSILEDLRQLGAGLAGTAGSRLKLVPGRIDEEAWADVREVLEPYRDQLRRLLRWTAIGGVAMRSEVLGGEIIYVTGGEGWVADPRGRAVYTPAEIRALEGSSPETIRQLHLAKVKFNGKVMI